VLGPWCLVRPLGLCPSLVRCPSFVLCPTPSWFGNIQRRLPTPKHPCYALVQHDQVGRLGFGEVVATHSDVVPGLQFPIRRERVSQKLQRLPVATSQETFSDVEYN
jgi:hypothetical protein